MTPRAKLFLGLAAGGAVVAIMASKSKKASAAEAPEEEAPGLIDFTPPPAAGTSPAPSLPPEFVPPLPGEVMPPPIEIPEDDEREDVVLEPVAPPFVPAPIAPVTPPPGPPPVVELPPSIIPPEVVDVLPPGIIPTPIVNPPPAPPRAAPPPEFVPAPVQPAPRPPPPAAEQPSQIPDDTVEVLRVMLPKERTKNWKQAEPVLAEWQEARGLTGDGKFGPGTAFVMATETGLLPIVRFWPRGSIKEQGAVDDYRNVLLTEANSAEEPRKSQLLAAAEREQGQGFGRGQEAITPTISI